MSVKIKKYTNYIETATFGAGCFWTVEVIFQQMKGVIEVVTGYSGGKTEHPTYFQVCQGNTGHAEVCRITFQPNEISYEELLEVFWLIHDPTCRDFQEYDTGQQYRSIIFYHSREQELTVKKYIKMLNSSGMYPSHIITEILPATTFYKAEECNINYYCLNSNTPYSLYVIAPKIRRFRKVFQDKLKKKAEYN
jgi:peptide-methionine (S)-S-oxide reductase